MASRGRVSRPWLCRLSMLVGLLAASLAAAAPMAPDDKRGTMIHEESLQPADASKQQAQQKAPFDVALISKAEIEECIDRAIPTSAHWKTCQEQKDDGFCTMEHNQWPGGYCVRTCGNCPQQAQVGVVQPPPSTTVKEESLAAAGSVKAAAERSTLLAAAMEKATTVLMLAKLAALASMVLTVVGLVLKAGSTL